MRDKTVRQGVRLADHIGMGVSSGTSFSHRRRLRLSGYDYARAGAYFLTICARKQQSLFGELVEGRIECTRIGRAIRSCWQEIPVHFPHVTLDAFVIMPNHVHGILLLADVGAEHARPLPVIVRAFKSAVSKRVGSSVWQRSYYDHIVRNEDELNRIRHYIDDNPLHWDTDEENLPQSGLIESWG